MFFLLLSNLSNNKITEIEDGAFEGASSVNELHLTANQIDSVRSGMFRGLDGLRMLWVAHMHTIAHASMVVFYKCEIIF